MRSKNYREENSEPGRYNEEALDYKLGIREQPGSQAAVSAHLITRQLCANKRHVARFASTAAERTLLPFAAAAPTTVSIGSNSARRVAFSSQFTNWNIRME